MTNVIIKGNRYRLIDNRSFELPLPLKCVVLKEDTEIAEYEISDDESVSYRILTKYKENMITPISRPLTIADMYYFFSCRVFQDKTPFTGFELSQLGLEKYNVYSIIRKTRGITPYDTYWIRFEGDKCDYETARNSWNEMMSKAASEQASAVGSAPGYASAAEAPAASGTEPDIDVGDILNQHKVDFAAAAAEHAPQQSDASVPSSGTMSADEIEQLLIQSGLTDASPAPEPEPAPTSATSGGNLSPDEIAKLFAANDTPASEPEPAPTSASSGGNLSPDEIAKLFAANDTPAPEPEPAPAPASSGGNLSPDEIAKLFAANDTPAPEPEPAPASASSGGNLSPDEIAKLFAANDTPAPEPEPAPAPASSGGNLSPDEIAKLFAANDTPAPEPEPAPAPASSGGKMSQDDIAKLFAASDTPAAEPEPEPAIDNDSIKAEAAKMSQEDIQKMLSEVGESVDGTASEEPAPVEETVPVDVEEPAPVEEAHVEAAPAEDAAVKSSGKMTQEDIEKMLNDQVNAVKEPIDINAPEASADETSAPIEDTAPLEPASADAAPASEDASGEGSERLSPEEIEALLGDMKKDAET